MKKLFVLIFIFTIPLFAEDKPQMTCQPMDVKINTSKNEVSSLMQEHHQKLNTIGVFLTLGSETKEAICFVRNEGISCIKK